MTHGYQPKPHDPPRRMPSRPPGAENPVALTIYFTDHGQDFLEWDVNRDGKVVASRPFQAWLWVGVRIMNLRGLKAGGKVIITRGKSEQPMAVHYLIERIQRG